MQAELIYNPSGGQVVVRHEIKEAVAFLESRGWTIDYRETVKPGEATELAHQAVQRGARVVIAAGGDGTVNEVANGLVHTDAAIGVLPVGTTNSWALQMGIPALNPWSPGTSMAKLVADIEERTKQPMPANYYKTVILNAARMLVEGRTATVDLGEVSGRYFLMWAGIGLDALILKSISPKDKKALGSWAYLFTTIGTLGRGSSTRVHLSLDGKPQEVVTQQIIVSNIQLYAGMMAIGEKARVDDSKLDVCIFKGDSFFTFIQHALRVLSHQHTKDHKTEYHQCHEIVIEPARAMPVHVDGEPFTETPVTIRTVPSALKVIVSNKAPRSLFCE